MKQIFYYISKRLNEYANRAIINYNYRHRKQFATNYTNYINYNVKCMINCKNYHAFAILNKEINNDI